MWREEETSSGVVLHLEAASWPELLEEAAPAFAAFLCDGAPPEPRLRAMRKIDAAGADAPETWLAWWWGLCRTWSEEGLLPLTAGVREDAGPGSVRGVVRCAPAGEVRARGDRRGAVPRGAEVVCDEEGWRGWIALGVPGP